MSRAETRLSLEPVLNLKDVHIKEQDGKKIQHFSHIYYNVKMI